MKNVYNYKFNIDNSASNNIYKNQFRYNYIEIVKIIIERLLGIIRINIYEITYYLSSTFNNNKGGGVVFFLILADN